MGKNDNKNYCIYCGKQIAVDNIYCPNCGNKQDKQITEVSVDGNNSRIIRQIKNKAVSFALFSFRFSY